MTSSLAPRSPIVRGPHVRATTRTTTHMMGNSGKRPQRHSRSSIRSSDSTTSTGGQKIGTVIRKLASRYYRPVDTTECRMVGNRLPLHVNTKNHSDPISQMTLSLKCHSK
jgi:hypothetical protein